VSRRAATRGIAAAAVLSMAAAGAFLVHRSPEVPVPSAPKGLRPPEPRVYHEKLEGSLYTNQDLGLRITAPSDWTPSLGKRSDELPAYEGLVLKMESKSEPDPETQFRPLLSVFKKSLPPGTAQDPVGYIRANLISPPKKVTDAPRFVSGASVAGVAYDMPTAKGSLRVRQLVRIVNSEAIIVTAFVPSGKYGELSAVIDRILASIVWSS